MMNQGVPTPMIAGELNAPLAEDICLSDAAVARDEFRARKCDMQPARYVVRTQRNGFSAMVAHFLLAGARLYRPA